MTSAWGDRTSSPTLWKLITGAAATAGCLYLLWLSLSLYPHNSDHYFFPRVAQNLVEHGGRFGNWALMSAPRYVPDLLIDIVSFSMVGSGSAGLALASILLVLIQCYAVSLVASRCGADLLTASLAGLVYGAGCVIAGAHYTSFSYISWHTGIFSLVIICLGLALRPPGSRGVVAGALLAVLAALAAVSDPLAVPLLVVGMTVVSAIKLAQNYLDSNYLLRFKGWWWTLLMPAGLTAIGCLSGMIVYRFLLPYPFDNPVDASGLSVGRILHPDLAFRAAVGTLHALFTEPVFVVAFALAATALCIFRRSASFALLCLAVGFWLVTSVGNQGMIELGSKDEPRYRIMPINGSIAVAGICIALLAARWRLRFVVPGLALGLMILTHVDVQSRYKQRYLNLMAEAECLSGHLEQIATASGSTADQLVGVSDLSTTKSYPYLSDGRLRLIATRGRSKSVLHLMQDVSLLNQTPVYAIARQQHDEQNYAARRPAYVLSRHNAIKQYGEPAASYLCGDLALMHYPGGLILSTPRHWQLPGS